MIKDDVKFKHSVVCVYKDKKSNIYTAPLIFDSEECALRHFDNMANRDLNVCDYDLYLIGHYSDAFGEIELLPNSEKYLLRSGDYYYEYISKLKDYTNNVNKLKNLYNEKYNHMLEFAKILYIGESSLTDEDFYNAFESFEKEKFGDSEKE